jgi:hypothetical protein
MIVVVSQPELQYTGGFSWIDDDAGGWDLSGDTGRLSTVRFHIIKSEDANYHVVLRKYSYGRTHEDALRRASKIQYEVSSRDSILDIGNGYTVDKESKFRGQQAEVEIRIPVGKKIHFDGSVPEKLNPANFRLKTSRRHKTTVNGRVVIDYYDDNEYFRFRTDIDYTMGNDGNLTDPSGKPMNNYGDYRYDEQPKQVTEDTSNLSIKEQLQREKDKKNESEKQRKESEQKIRELEKKQKEEKPSGSIIEKLSDGKNAGVANASRSVLSLAESFL